ncbi:hypothetical protein BLA29_006691 [Euroglyphus maynei]|uniref:Uncharacterized protein n=1 Tax=Euroglyphus maynei TaxID=6958 RepID=A0A1Y3B471_EURMA|nr:hypothetical protein BLA29_006691 [Euroglyphus maynei]
MTFLSSLNNGDARYAAAINNVLTTISTGIMSALQLTSNMIERAIPRAVIMAAPAQPDTESHQPGIGSANELQTIEGRQIITGSDPYRSCIIHSAIDFDSVYGLGRPSNA